MAPASNPPTPIFGSERRTGCQQNDAQRQPIAYPVDIRNDIAGAIRDRSCSFQPWRQGLRAVPHECLLWQGAACPCECCDIGRQEAARSQKQRAGQFKRELCPVGRQGTAILRNAS